MDKDHELIVSAQMYQIIERRERDTVMGTIGLPVEIKKLLQSHGWLSKKDADTLRNENKRLRDAMMRYSVHKQSCAYLNSQNDDCSCGLWEALEKK